MSETTQILFNSPALHSLKREQLVKLAKIHSLKANGKNVEIIERLKAHALTLPTSDPLSIATRSEDPRYGDVGSDDVDMEPPSPSSTFTHSNMPRPSEQWEVVMDDIQEAEEKDSPPGTMNSQRTVTGAAGEFGTATSKSSSIGSSLKTLASSLGLKRAMSDKNTGSLGATSSKSPLPPVDDEELTKHSTRYSRLPEPRPSDAPLTDHFKFSTPDASFGDEPLPGDEARPGKLAPADSRLSLGTSATPGPTTTIRLVSAAPSRTTNWAVTDTPQLKPFATSFDLVMGSPDKDNRVPVWPLTPGGAKTTSLYPTLPAEDLADARAHAAVATPDRSIASISHTPASQVRPRNDVDDLFSPTKLKPPAAEPAFVFGSPMPQKNEVTNKAFGSAAEAVLSEMNRRLSEAGAAGAKLDPKFLENRPRFDSTATTSSAASADKSADRFARAHQDQFAKMDSIANHYAARRPAPATRPSAGIKRKSDAAGLGAGPSSKRPSAGTRVVSGRRRAPIPGGFGDEDDDDDEGDVEKEQDRRASKRIRVEENDGELRAGKRPSIAPSAKQEKEREATRRALEAKKERRRSSMRTPRVSVTAAQAQKNKSRFGFLSSAKTVVRSLWGSSKPAASSIPKTAPAPPKPVHSLGKVIPESVRENAKAKAVEEKPQPQAPSQKNGSLSSARGLFKPVSRTRAAELSQKAAPPPTSSIASRKSVAPSGHTRTASISSVASTATARPAAGSGHQRSNSVATGATASSSLRYSGRPSAMPSTGVKTGMVRPSSMSTAASLGARSDATTVSSMGSRKPSGSGIPSSTSRLLAPTASSLAKTRGSTANKRESTLSQITNSPGPSPRKDTPGKIFSTPLSGTLSPSMIPSPVKPTSLGLAAATLAATTGTEPKPKAPMARRPRVSRSKVIAKLGAQRAAAASGLVSGSGSTLAPPKSTLAPRASGPAPRLRSSTGAAARRSFAGGPKARGSDVLLSAKKHARQSEQARRRTRAGGSAIGARASNAVSPGKLFAAANTSSGSAMDIDD
ncbi:unnamed protein product [Peniophora sp. CBMAI 1063]|nr:unnamed protein product [Peniophora sp. CBMAI 1063]